MACSEESYFTASDGAKIFVRTFQPAPGRPLRAVLHVHHGMGEHSARYAGLAGRLTEEGFIVIAHDARGHGRTSEQEGSPGLGCVRAGPEGAVPRIVADLGEMLLATQTARPNLPILLFGHSFGTIVSQLCLGAGAGGARVRGLVLSAPPARVLSAMAPAVRLLMAGVYQVHGEHGISKIPGKMSFDKFNGKALAATKHKGVVTGWEWLNRDTDEITKYINDPFCGHDMSMGFWSSFIPALLRIKTPQAHAKLPPQLPICILAGDHDFCTIDDVGVPSYDRIRAELANAGKATPKVVVYPKARHELLLELNREEVMDDTVRFLLQCLDAPQTSKL